LHGFLWPGVGDMQILQQELNEEVQRLDAQSGVLDLLADKEQSLFKLASNHEGESNEAFRDQK